MIPLPLAFGLSLVVGAALGLMMRQLLGDRVRVGWEASVLAGIVGAFLGTGAVAVAVRERDGVHPIAGLAAAALGTVVVLLALSRLRRPTSRTTRQLLADGESATVEFKSTARCNLRTGQRDERIELVIAKTVAALANSAGGDLLIGVSDDGEVVGIEADLPFMKEPDTDRYELWLRDHLTRTLGAAAAAAVEVTFPQSAGRILVRVTVPAAARPVLLTPGRSEGPQLWVRVGNSTRQLPLDQALAYASDRWGRRRLRSLRT